MRRLLFLALAAFAALAEGTGWARAQPYSVVLPVIAPLPVAGMFVPAAETPPDVLLNAATSELTAALKQEHNQRTIAELVNSTILPLFDFRHMTKLAMARDWRLASPEQRNAVVAEFRTLLVRTYSAALANYRDEAIEYKPMRVAPGQTEVTVKSTVKQPGAERLAIDYDMQKMASGWKVYDIKIAGISLITNYRSSFAHIIRDAGVDGLIGSLAAKNRQREAGLRTDESGARYFLFMFAVVPSFSRDGR